MNEFNLICPCVLVLDTVYDFSETSQTWILLLQEYDFELSLVAGKDNIIAVSLTTALLIPSTIITHLSFQHYSNCCSKYALLMY